MRHLYAVDPGVDFCAVARFELGVLAVVQHQTSPMVPHLNMRVVCEIPQVYDPRKAKSVKRPSDLIDLAVCAGRMTGAVECEYVVPNAWKGQLPCTCGPKVPVTECIHHRRMWNELAPHERGVLEAATSQVKVRHNMYDAVALGLVVLNRLTPAGVRGTKIGQEA